LCPLGGKHWTAEGKVKHESRAGTTHDDEHCSQVKEWGAEQKVYGKRKGFPKTVILKLSLKKRILRMRKSTGSFDAPGREEILS